MAEKIFRVNMGDLSVKSEAVPTAWQGLRGRALTSTIVATEVEPTCHPLGKNNKLVFAPGLLSGTRAANSGRLSAGAKSPLTGTIKECNAGGTAAHNFRSGHFEDHEMISGEKMAEMISERGGKVKHGCRNFSLQSPYHRIMPSGISVMKRLMSSGISR